MITGFYLLICLFYVDKNDKQWHGHLLYRKLTIVHTEGNLTDTSCVLVSAKSLDISMPDLGVEARSSY